MKSRRGGLGRGLGALIPTDVAIEDRPTVGVAGRDESARTAVPGRGGPGSDARTVAPAATEAEEDLAPVPGAQFRELPVATIEPNPRQPRQVFDEEAMEELKLSITEVGFLQPVVVREVVPGQYELVMGERRWRAAQALGRDTIPAIVRDTPDDDMLRAALLENIHRANLNPLEEAAAYQQLLEEFGATHDELAKRIGRSRPQISNTIRLLNLPPSVQRRVAAGVLSAGHARALLALDDVATQEALALRIVAEGLSVRVTEELVSVGAPAKQPKDSPARRPRPHAPALDELADKLSDRFDTRVKVDLGRSTGKIVIEFATVDDLERIVGVIGLQAGGDGAAG